MGTCCSSVASDSKQPLKRNDKSQSIINSQKKEDKIELAFKAKRANIFTEGVDFSREAFSQKKVHKTDKQKHLIMNAISTNYIFANLNDQDKNNIMMSMDIVDVSSGENIITQGQEGDYFYIIEKGSFTVIVDNSIKPGKLSEGNSFGELALLYNAPRQATIRCDSEAVLFSLDRETYRYIIAQSSAVRDLEIKKALSKVPILIDLTEEQLDRLADSVETFPYKPGDVIIKKGSEGNIFYMIKEGTVLVSELDSQYADHTLTTGDYFGERALLTGEPRAATVTAKTDVKVMALDRLSFNALLGPLKEVLDNNMNLRILNSIKIFEKLNKNERKILAKSLTLEVFTVGTVIIKQGDVGRKFYIMKDGEAKVLVDETEVSKLATGTYFGEMALLDDDVRKASVIATRTSECFVLDRDTFSRILNSLQHAIGKETKNRLEVLKGVVHDDVEQQLNLKFTELVPIAILGSGTFGRVSLVQDKKSKAVYALKAMMKSEIVAHKQQANVINEKDIMIKSNHPFILRLYQTFKDSKKLYMLLEFVQGGELFSVLHTAQGDGVPDHQAKFYGAGILLAIGYLHSKDIAYRDMKPENCLIDKNGYPKLVDFGFAKVITGKSYTLCGTPEYLAPELVLARGHNKAVDYWAFGILLYEMQAGYSPYADLQGMDQVVICKNIVSGRLAFPRAFNNDCKVVLLSCR